MDLNEIAKKRIAEAIKEVSVEYKLDEQKIKRELQDLLTAKGKGTDPAISILSKIWVSCYDIFKASKKGVLNIRDLEKIIIPQIQDKLIREERFENFLKKKHIKNIPIPQKESDLEKIPKLEEFPPEVFEDFIIRIANNLDKVHLDILGVLIPEILEVIGPPTKLPPCMNLKLIELTGYVGTIVEWEAKFHSLRAILEKDERIEKESKMSIPKGAYVLILAKNETYLDISFKRFLNEAVEARSEFLLPSKMNEGERVVAEILDLKKVSYSKISLTDKGLREFYRKSLDAFYILPSNILNLISSKFEWESFKEYENLKGRRREILSMAMENSRWKPSDEIKEEIIREMIQNMMDDTTR